MAPERLWCLRCEPVRHMCSESHSGSHPALPCTPPGSLLWGGSRQAVPAGGLESQVREGGWGEGREREER